MLCAIRSRTAGRDREAARTIASTLDGHAEVVRVDEAIERADVLVLAVWFDIAKQLITEYGDRLVGKVAGELVAELIRAGGYEPVRVGGLDKSIRIEAFGDLHELGALGRVVTRSEALTTL